MRKKASAVLQRSKTGDVMMRIPLRPLPNPPLYPHLVPSSPQYLQINHFKSTPTHFFKHEMTPSSRPWVAESENWGEKMCSLPRSVTTLARENGPWTLRVSQDEGAERTRNYHRSSCHYTPRFAHETTLQRRQKFPRSQLCRNSQVNLVI